MFSYTASRPTTGPDRSTQQALEDKHYREGLRHLEFQDRIEPQSGCINALAFSPSGDMLACGCDEGCIVVYAMPSQKKIQTLQGHSSNVFAVVWASPVHIISGANDGDVRIYNLESGSKASH